MTTVVSILISDLVPLRDRGLWQGIINIIYASGSGIGAPLGEHFYYPETPWRVETLTERIGGILADYIGWRW
jgi:MFS family permease